MGNKLTPAIPTKELVKKYIKDFDNTEGYLKNDEVINKLFLWFPKNNKIEEVILKVNIINSIYKTRIVETYKVAKHIVETKCIDDMIEKGNYNVINKIAFVPKSEKNQKEEKRYYSFATKYCHFHNDKYFSIYDSFVDGLIWSYKIYSGLDGLKTFNGFRHKDLRQYDKFIEILKNFKVVYQLEFGTRDFDKFLWLYGKEYIKNIFKEKILNDTTYI